MFRRRKNPRNRKRLVKYDVLVHPFWKVMTLRDTRLSDIKFMAGVWGKQVKVIAENPNRILIVFKTMPVTKEMGCYLERFYDFIRSELGQRAIFCNTMRSEELINQLNKAGYTLKHLKRAEGIVYGELYDSCVRDIKELLEELTGKQIAREPWLSIESRYSREFARKKVGLGEYWRHRKKNPRTAQSLRKQSKPFWRKGSKKR